MKIKDVKEIYVNELNMKTKDVKDAIIYYSAGNLYWKDNEFRYLGCNKNFSKINQLSSPKEIIGKTDRELFHRHLTEEEIQKLHDTDKRVIREGVDVLCEETGINENGEKATFLSKKIPLKNINNEIIGLIGTSIDITKQKQVEKLKTEFISNMEHDIRTPFVGIYGAIDILAKQETDPEKKSILNDVVVCAKELMDYCDSILDFSNVESGLSPVLSKNFRLTQTIESILLIESVAAKEKKLNLSLEYDDKLPPVIIGDPYRIKRILINLVSNAIKFTEKGFVKLSVSLAKQNQGSREIVVQFVIEDSGIGIPDNKQTLIYERFTKITPSNKGLYKGLGLGLRIVKQFVNELDGDIHLKSKINQGSTFTLFLPFKLPLSDEIIDEE